MNEQLFMEHGLVTIMLASAITYGLRLGGLLLAGILPSRGPARWFLDGLPGSILIALVVPAAIQEGPVGLVGIVACMLGFMVTRNLLVTMAAGVVTVWLLRMGGLF
jgi:uncharacterized membrane protein